MPRCEVAPVAGRWMAVIEPVVTEHFGAQRALRIFVLGEPAILKNRQQVLIKFLIGTGNHPVDQVHAIDAGLLLDDELICDLLRRSDEAGVPTGRQSAEIGDSWLPVRHAFAHPFDVTSAAIRLHFGQQRIGWQRTAVVL